MDEGAWLAERFEENRSHLRGVAYRMLGSLTEADDAVQEAWIRLSRTDTSDVDNLRAWLTTVVARVCLNMLRSRKTRRESSLERRAPFAERGSESVEGRLPACELGVEGRFGGGRLRHSAGRLSAHGVPRAPRVRTS